MTIVRVIYDELWVPWEMTDDLSKNRHFHVDLPDELIARFHAAKEEMENIWTEIMAVDPERQHL
jgi:hypothetical protein